jgi:hypothetical protein
MDGAVGIRKIGSICSISRMENFDHSRLRERPPRLNIERQRSFDERSLRLCLGVGFWRGREGKERLGKRSTLVWEF